MAGRQKIRVCPALCKLFMKTYLFLGARVGACVPPCENDGRCRKNGSCKCRPGYYGKTCASHRNDIAEQSSSSTSKADKAQLIQRYLAAAGQQNRP